MAEYNVKVRFKNRRDTSSNWTSKNPIILNGEIILVDTSAGDVRVKVGDGAKHYSELPFLDEKINVGTAYRALVTDASGRLSTSSVTSTELGYMSGVTSAVQTQLNNKVPMSRTVNGLQLSNNINLTAKNVGAQPTITVNGIVQGDGSGNLSAAEIVEAETIELNAAAVGLGNVDNIKQYSSSNPPPYPVTSVNGKTGAVEIQATFVINVDISNVADKTFAEFMNAYRAGYACIICYDSNSYFSLVEVSTEFAVFSSVNSGNMYTLIWQLGASTLSFRKVQQSFELSSSSSDLQYPTSRAVWNAIPHPETKTEVQTQPVGIDSDGKLWTAKDSSPVNMEILDVICEDVELTDSNSSYTFPTPITIDTNGLYYINYRYYVDNTYDESNSGCVFAKPLTENDALCVRGLAAASNNSITFTSTSITDTWRGSGAKAVVSIYKVTIAITDKFKYTMWLMGGHNNTASGVDAHVEGSTNTASGIYSHVEGSTNTASGDYSHAEGRNNTADGLCSHAEGENVIASGARTHVQGMFNIDQSVPNGGAKGTYCHIVGNGAKESARSNAHTLDWSGNAWFAGDVYVGSTSGTNKDAGSKKLATEVPVTAADNGKFLRVVNGVWAADTVPSAGGVAF